MGLKDLFNTISGKREKEYEDILHIKPTELKPGYVFDYDLKSWKVLESYKYDWGDGFYSDEHKITDGALTFHLSVEDDDELELVLFDKLKFSALQEDFRSIIKSGKDPLNELHISNDTFYFEEENPGYFRDDRENKEENWTELISWSYYNKSGEKCLSIEQWDDNSFELSLGTVIRPHQISNIIPAETK